MAYVMMAVPAELVSAVAEFIEGPRGSKASGAVRPPDPGGFVQGWARPAVRRAYRESGDGMREVLDFLARHPDREVSSYELADAIEAKYGWNTVAGMLGAFGRRCANRYGLKRPMWEFRHDASGRVLLTMPRAAAKAVEESAQGS